MSFERIHGDHLEEFTKQEIYKLITCSVDIDNRLVMDLWKDYCREYREVDELEFPYSPGTDLYDMESYYKMLDLYFQFSRKTGLPVQEENLFHERRSTEEEISRILRTECGSYTRKCSICGRELSWDHPFSICERCFERGRSSQKRSRFTISGITIKTHTTGSATMIPQYLKISARRKAAMIFQPVRSCWSIWESHDRPCPEGCFSR